MNKLWAFSGCWYLLQRIGWKTLFKIDWERYVDPTLNHESPNQEQKNRKSNSTPKDNKRMLRSQSAGLAKVPIAKEGS